MLVRIKAAYEDADSPDIIEFTETILVPALQRCMDTPPAVRLALA